MKTHSLPLNCHCIKKKLLCDVALPDCRPNIFFFNNWTVRCMPISLCSSLHCWKWTNVTVGSSMTCHISNRIMEFVMDFFSEHLVSKGLWPPHYPDLMPLNYLLWGYSKVVFTPIFHTWSQIWRSITTAITDINIHMLHRVSCNLIKHAGLCICKGGSHFQHLL